MSTEVWPVLTSTVSRGCCRARGSISDADPAPARTTFEGLRAHLGDDGIGRCGIEGGELHMAAADHLEGRRTRV